MGLRTAKNFALAALACLCLAPRPASADLTITKQTWTEISSPLASAKHAEAEPLGATTLYISDDKSRTDLFFVFSEISDGKKVYLLNRAKKSYVVGIGDTSQLSKFLSSEISEMQSQEASKTETVTPTPGHEGDRTSTTYAGGTYTNIEVDIKPRVLKIIDTGQTTSYLGHSVHRYIGILQAPLGTGSKPIKIRQVTLTATDFPPAEVAEYKKACKDDLDQPAIPGIPLKVTTNIPVVGFAGGSPVGAASVQAVTAISTKPLAAAVFAIPTGYVSVAAAAK